MILSSCAKEDCVEGTGPVGTEVLYTASFEGIRSEASIDIFIENGDTQEVRAVGHANIIDRLQLDVMGDILHIDLQSDCYRDYELALYITTPNIEKVYLDGSGSIDIDPMENESDLLIDIQGSGQVTMDAISGVQNLDVRIDGSGTVRAFDDFPDLVNLNIDIEGSGDYRGFDLITENCEVSIDGSGDCRVHVTENLDVNIQGSGDVYYRGTPNISSNISGSGDLVNAN